MSTNYRFQKTIPGTAANAYNLTFGFQEMIVSGTRDSRGITLSIGNTKNGDQFSIALEPILKEMKILVGGK